jgi:hypothetical protein
VGKGSFFYLFMFEGSLEVGRCTDKIILRISVKETDYGMAKLN